MFPLITLQPIANGKNAWAALLLEGDHPLDGQSLSYILHVGGLAAVLPFAPCLVLADPAAIDAEVLAGLPDGRLMLHSPAEGATVPEWGTLAFAVGHAATPPTSKGNPSRAPLLKLLSLVTADADTAEIEAVVKRDPHLSYQLLKLVNSVAFSPNQHITSFGQAIALLGRRQLQRWLQLLLYTRSPDSPMASPLLPRAALRASLMERLAKQQGQASLTQDHAFMVGMFSLLDQLLGVSLNEVLPPLKLPEDVLAALLAGTGRLGELAAIVKASEGPPTEALANLLDAAGIDRPAWAGMLTGAAGWALQIGREA